MINAWIKKDDIRKILLKAKDVDGLINKREFQYALLECKEYKEPQKRRENKVNRVKNVHEIIGNINKYKRDFKSGVFERHLQYKKDANTGTDKKICSCHKEGCFLRNIDLTDKKIKLYEDNEEGGEVEIKENDIVFDKLELMKILKVSKSTISRWINSDIIEKYIGEVHVKIDGCNDFECILWYYRLDDIKKNIRMYYS